MPSTWIPTAEITAQRAEVEKAMPSSCVIYRMSETSDGQGGMAQTYAAIGTVDCRLAARRGSERYLAAQASPVGAFVLTVPHDTTIAAADRVTVDSVNYRVVFVDAAEPTWRLAKRAEVDLEVV
jgi:SPP1 family predicted phage head-tail adaptor